MSGRGGCLRLRFDYRNGDVALAGVRLVEMVPPPSDDLAPRDPAAWAGAWFEVHDAGGHPIYRKVMPSPMHRTEEPAGPGSERLPRPTHPATGSFCVLIPRLAAGAALVVYASPIGRGGRRYPAREMTRVPLPVRPTTRGGA